MLSKVCNFLHYIYAEAYITKTITQIFSRHAASY